MADAENRSRLVRLYVRNIGCIGNDGIDIALDKVVCLVGKNNAGKSTILRAYELAKGTAAFDPTRDRHQSAGTDEPSEVILDVHIPDGIANIDNAWKIDAGGLRIVRSRWQWTGEKFDKVRTTWDPQADGGKGSWDAEKKASGLDNVFSSRLPRPLRIGSLDDAEKTQEMLLTLALTPLLSALEAERAKTNSPLSQAIASVTQNINALSVHHEHEFNAIAEKISTGFKGVFPSLNVKLEIGAAPLIPKVEELVKKGSGLKVEDGNCTTSLGQQGTGARRALFWSMLQVHNEMTRDKEIRDDFRKRTEKMIADAKKVPKKETPEQTIKRESELATLEAQLAAHMDGAPIPDSPEDPALPGYLLLIDEPENALHPMAARAAQRHLYQLAMHPDWQVMMTTHSPYFINPFDDHTTIVRLERQSHDSKAPVTPKTYRSDSIEFEKDEKPRLQALQQMDPSLAEIFFGSYPILVEGDTEHAAFLATVVEPKHELINKVTIVRARGKAILRPLIKVLAHFKIGFGIIHDCDPPFRSDGNANGMWTENEKIRLAITQARQSGVTIRHRVSVPDFERYLGSEAETKDKPHHAYAYIKSEAAAAQRIQGLLNELMEGAQHEPFADDIFAKAPSYEGLLKTTIEEWALKNGLSNDIRFCGKPVKP